jgi:hypothetical protein
MTKINFTNEFSSDNSDNFVMCDYCKKKGKQNDFNGRFCSKICIGKFAQM